MNTDELQKLLKPVTDHVSNSSVSSALGDDLNRTFPEGSATFDAIERACHEAIAEGWMCAQGDEGRRFGRVIKPGDETGGLSVDVVELDNFVGPHHTHPNGEICMIMPVDKDAKFDGFPRGWCVFEPGSDHHPTVTGGKALVLYMLPDGKIEFT